MISDLLSDGELLAYTPDDLRAVLDACGPRDGARKEFAAASWIVDRGAQAPWSQNYRRLKETRPDLYIALVRHYIFDEPLPETK